MRPFRGSKYYRDLAEECRTVAEVGPRQWKASYLRLAQSYETLANEMEAPSPAGGSARAHLSILWNAEQFAAADVIG